MEEVKDDKMIEIYYKNGYKNGDVKQFENR